MFTKGRHESGTYLGRVLTDEIDVKLTNPLYTIDRIVSKLREGIILSRRIERSSILNCLQIMVEDE